MQALCLYLTSEIIPYESLQAMKWQVGTTSSSYAKREFVGASDGSMATKYIEPETEVTNF